jgi:hypothetical protein
MTIKKIIGPITAATFLSTVNYGLTQAAPSYRTDCEPIARNYKSGKIVCKGDVLDVKAPITLFCFLNQKWMDMTHISVAGNVCEAPKTTRRGTIKRCTQFNAGNPSCDVSKGGSSIDKPEIIAPYTGTLIDGRPHFSWAKVPTATSYVIQLSGKGVAWSQETTSTDLTYPSSQPPLRPGEIYQVVTTAFEGATPLESDTTALTMLPSAEIEQVHKQVTFVTHQGFPSDETAYLDLDAIFRGHNLYTETINTLNSRVKQKTQDPNLYRILANRYCQVGLPQFARINYDKGMILAQQQNNQLAVKKIKFAMAGLTTSSPQE